MRIPNKFILERGKEVQAMKRNFMFGFVIVVTVCMVLAVGVMAYSAEKAKSAVAYPQGYRTWAHVKSMVILQGHQLYETFGGIHHIYANEKALKALKSGKPYPNGSVFVFDLLETKTENNATTEGPRKVLGVMQKDSKKFAETGGWGYEGFKGDTRDRIVTDMKNCFKCHEKQTQTGFVFSQYRK
jgi:hypothetical protein